MSQQQPLFLSFASVFPPRDPRPLPDPRLTYKRYPGDIYLNRNGTIKRVPDKVPKPEGQLKTTAYERILNPDPYWGMSATDLKTFLQKCDYVWLAVTEEHIYEKCSVIGRETDKIFWAARFLRGRALNAFYSETDSLFLVGVTWKCFTHMLEKDLTAYETSGKEKMANHPGNPIKQQPGQRVSEYIEKLCNLEQHIGFSNLKGLRVALFLSGLSDEKVKAAVWKYHGAVDHSSEEEERFYMEQVAIITEKKMLGERVDRHGDLGEWLDQNDDEAGRPLGAMDLLCIHRKTDLPVGSLVAE